MCGIAGYVGSREIDRQTLDGCLRLMKRRGPDHAAWRSWTRGPDHRAYLLSARLSIIDLDPRSHQPLAAGRTTVSFNGALYNFIELRDELSAAGDRFETASDTEVFARAIDRWGHAAWDRFEGMWAAAVYDEDRGTLTLTRDRFGEKPLFVFEDGSGVYFASEPKCISALVGRRLEINRQQLLRFLVNGYRALHKGPETFFRDLRELQPGTWLRIAPEGSTSTGRYWTWSCESDDGIDYQAAVRGVRARLTRAVEIRLRADVPLAFCLSGGVDSSALVGIATRLCGRRVHGFTVIDDDPRYDERQVVERSVDELDIRHTFVPTSHADFLERLRALVRYHDSPVSTISYVAHARLMERIAREGFRVAVSGTGADEIFTGYFDHHLAYLAEVRDSPCGPAARAAWERMVRPFVRNPHLADPELFVRDPTFRGHLYFPADRYAAFLRQPWRETFVEERYCPDLLRNRMANELFRETVPVILHEDDLNSMFWSIENRSPYLDRPLVEFCARIPTSLLIRNGFAKALLRDAVRGLVPSHVLDNPRKVGFNAPIASFLDINDSRVRGWLRADSPIDEYVRRDEIERLLEQKIVPNSDSKFLFNVVSSRMFLEEFAV